MTYGLVDIPSVSEPDVRGFESRCHRDKKTMIVYSYKKVVRRPACCRNRRYSFCNHAEWYKQSVIINKEPAFVLAVTTNGKSQGGELDRGSGYSRRFYCAATVTVRKTPNMLFVFSPCLISSYSPDILEMVDCYTLIVVTT